MGVAFKDLVFGKEIELKDINNEILVIDTYNLLYQFLSSIRARDGTLFTDSKGKVTSHLIGLFSRITNLMKYTTKLVFVFDGKAPLLKQKERERRKFLKIQAQKSYLEAKKVKDTELMRKFASRTSILTDEMINDAKELIENLGMPIVQAPSEGEAQVAYIAKKENCFAVSQDYDSLLYGVSKLIRNLSITGKRKQSNKLSYSIVKPELINLVNILNNLSIDKDQLIIIAMLIGTDYNNGGIKGIGPKNALSLVKNFGNDFNSLFMHVKWDEHFNFSWNEVYNLFKKMPVTDDYSLKWKTINTDKLKEFLLEHDFSIERIKLSLDKLNKKEEEKKQKSLGDF
jgi:flap endonuclease-1